MVNVVNVVNVAVRAAHPLTRHNSATIFILSDNTINTFFY